MADGKININRKFTERGMLIVYRIIIIPVIIASVLSVVLALKNVIDTNLAAQKLNSVIEGDMQSFEMEDLEGGQYDETMFEGHRITVINVWATFCGPCIKEMPDLQKLSEEYDEADVRFVGMIGDVYDSSGLLSDDKLEETRSIVKETGVKYPVLIPSPEIYEGAIGNLGGVFPTTLFFNEEGDVLLKVTGSRSKDSWRDTIDGVLANEE